VSLVVAALEAGCVSEVFSPGSSRSPPRLALTALTDVLPLGARWRSVNCPRQPGLATLEMEPSPLRVLRGKERNVSEGLRDGQRHSQERKKTEGSFKFLH